MLTVGKRRSDLGVEKIEKKRRISTKEIEQLLCYFINNLRWLLTIKTVVTFVGYLL